MSLILDALNRSRQDVGDTPGLESQHLPPGSERSALTRVWPLALFIAVGIIAFLLYERAVAPEPVATQPQAEQSESTLELGQPVSRQTVPAVTEADARNTDTHAQPKRQAVPDAAVDALYTGGESADQAPAEQGLNTVKQTVSKAPGKRIKRASASQPQKEEAINIEQALQRAQSELENARLEEHAAPFLESLSQQAKNRIPTIYYERHDYSGNPGQSRVVFSGKKMRQGEKTTAGVRVDEILADSVVLSYQGTQFRLRALNSWVNL